MQFSRQADHLYGTGANLIRDDFYSYDSRNCHNRAEASRSSAVAHSRWRAEAGASSAQGYGGIHRGIRRPVHSPTRAPSSFGRTWEQAWETQEKARRPSAVFAHSLLFQPS
jgi:hypothetical protein